ncbi:MAG TPA: signal recognition particle-docking protein FtsY, partial [Solirubrobacteraceae bacterium]|nr:signal recognition particle-docking protein FtsY [Solirubrobacteraceae bacterium]
MGREWADLFLTEQSAGQQARTSQDAGKERGGGLFRRLRENLSKTRQALGSEIQATLFTTIDE